jgi:hypothetical protein
VYWLLIVDSLLCLLSLSRNILRKKRMGGAVRFVENDRQTAAKCFEVCKIM